MNSKIGSSIYVVIIIAALTIGFFAGKIFCTPKQLTKKEAVQFLKSKIPLSDKVGTLTYQDFLHIYSDPILIKDAKNRHMEYLNSKYPIYFPNSDTAQRSFFLDYDDILTLIDYTDYGVRVYLANDKKDSLNLIFVPQTNKLENLLIDNAIINTLSPCPNDCPTDASDPKKSSSTDLNYNNAIDVGGIYKWRKRLKTETKKTWENAEKTKTKEF